MKSRFIKWRLKVDQLTRWSLLYRRHLCVKPKTYAQVPIESKWLRKHMEIKPAAASVFTLVFSSSQDNVRPWRSIGSLTQSCWLCSLLSHVFSPCLHPSFISGTGWKLDTDQMEIYKKQKPGDRRTSISPPVSVTSSERPFPGCL